MDRTYVVYYGSATIINQGITDAMLEATDELEQRIEQNEILELIGGVTMAVVDDCVVLAQAAWWKDPSPNAR